MFWKIRELIIKRRSVNDFPVCFMYNHCCFDFLYFIEICSRTTAVFDVLKRNVVLYFRKNSKQNVLNKLTSVIVSVSEVIRTKSLRPYEFHYWCDFIKLSKFCPIKLQLVVYNIISSLVFPNFQRKFC